MNSEPQIPVSDNTSPVWPRRASRACANCRRDKIRCDGSRPCTGCTKKGYAAEQCIDGCDPCRRARVRCEGGKPCQRCRDMHVECLEEVVVVAPTPRQEFPPASLKTSRANGADRAKLACTNCRRDNKKCDDQRPCARCIARSEECIHVGRGPKLVKLRCESCRQDNKRCEDARPCKFCVEGQKQCITQPRRGRGHGTRVKAACVSCRRDKIRCDGIRPCASCVRKGYECLERACKSCSREGLAAECTHNKVVGTGTSENPEDDMDSVHSEPKAFSPNNEYRPPPAQPPPHHLHPQLSHPNPYAMYDPSHTSSGPVSQFYYTPQQHMMGPGQSPHMMQTYLSEQRTTSYYPVIDPSIDDSGPSNSSVMFPGRANQP